ncbi:hypothetical protein DL764_002823 [Monosporascus ibericus]|uniref:Uncharacterized protein n=1 Tax=Monosporascus ibericus TaxID=155417 RepID=A0A4Q4TN58_9PEZI|nr:hypothetical protein DL764_002823 [Monosporascus ibericus]
MPRTLTSCIARSGGIVAHSPAIILPKAPGARGASGSGGGAGGGIAQVQLEPVLGREVRYRGRVVSAARVAAAVDAAEDDVPHAVLDRRVDKRYGPRLVTRRHGDKEYGADGPVGAEDRLRGGGGGVPFDEGDVLRVPAGEGLRLFGRR